MLATVLPLAAIAVAGLAIWSKKSSQGEGEPSDKVGGSAHASGGICLALGILCLAVGTVWKETLTGAFQAGIGALVGAILAALSGFLGSRFDKSYSNRFAPIALGVLGVALTVFLPVETRTAGILGLCFSLSACAWILSIAPTPWPGQVATASFLIGLPSIFGTFGYGDRATQFPLVLGLALAALGIVVEMAVPKTAKSRDPILAIGFVIFGAAAAYLLANKFAFLTNLGMIAGLAGIGALVTQWMLPEVEDSKGSSIALSSLLWIAIATVAFSMRGGFGISVLALSGGLFLLGFGNFRAVLVLGPVVAIAAFRLLREISESSKALDIGQHYGMMGLVVGAALVLIAAEWLKENSSKTGVKTAIAGLCWAGIFVVIPACIAIVLGSKGFIGAIAGVGFGSVLAMLVGVKRGPTFQACTALFPLLILEYPWLTQKLDLTREMKMQSLIIFALLIVVFAGTISWISRNESTKGTS